MAEELADVSGSVGHDSVGHDTPTLVDQVMDAASEAHEQDEHDQVGHRNAAIVICAFGLLFLLVVVQFFFRSSTSKQSRPKARTPLPAFDVEGASNSGNGLPGPSLHHTIAAAAANADVATIRDWLADDRCMMNATMGDGSTALHHAARAGHANIVRMLLDAGADVLSVDAQLSTPLHLVAAGGHGLCVKALLDAGSDPEANDATGASPLELAESGQHMGTARMMRTCPPPSAPPPTRPNLVCMCDQRDARTTCC